MDKICIVKRRRMGPVATAEFRPEPPGPARSRVVTIELTRDQVGQVRSNERFQNMYGSSQTPILLNLHLDTPFPSKMLTSQQICDMLQISMSTLKRLLKEGTFKSHRIGRLRRFAVEDVMEYLGSNLQVNGLRNVLGAHVP